MKNTDDEAMKAFRAWDNHLRDCKATRLEKPKGDDGPEVKVAHPCVYDGDKCSRGMALYLNWRKAIGSPVFQPKLASGGN